MDIKQILFDEDKYQEAFDKVKKMQSVKEELAPNRLEDGLETQYLRFVINKKLINLLFISGVTVEEIVKSKMFFEGVNEWEEETVNMLEKCIELFDGLVDEHEVIAKVEQINLGNEYGSILTKYKNKNIMLYGREVDIKCKEDILEEYINMVLSNNFNTEDQIIKSGLDIIYTYDGSWYEEEYTDLKEVVINDLMNKAGAKEVEGLTSEKLFGKRFNLDYVELVNLSISEDGLERVESINNLILESRKNKEMLKGLEPTLKM
ncbi:MAG: hypothetical protein N4A47_07015 [Clostridia bacterium]|jgi:hypothetical protein|nr:hypothetical protein [Clostridia bacterium]